MADIGLCLLISVVLLLGFSSLVAIFSAAPCKLYHTALEDSLLFFEGQRSGKLPPDQRVKWRGDSGLDDGLSANVDLVGGYYIDGSNVKLGLPMAFSVTMLSWGVIEYGPMMGDQLDAAKTAVKWGSDYLLKAAASTPNTIYAQVGDVGLNDTCWERPEDMNKSRSVYNVSKKNPGSDVAGEISAALATASVLFRQSDPVYSSRLIATAVKVFEFAESNRGSYNVTNNANPCLAYCASSDYHDELLWSASWLYLVTGNSSYLQYVQKNIDYLKNDEKPYPLNWNDKTLGIKVLFAKLYLQNRDSKFQTFKHDVDESFCSLFTTSSLSHWSYTPGGLLFQNDDSNMQYVTSTAFLLLTYASYLQLANMSVFCGINVIQPEKLIDLAQKQVDYVLGHNPAGISYMVGYKKLRKKYPEHIYHMASSMPSKYEHPNSISCKSGQEYLHSSSPNPNILVGAVVGGPNLTDSFDDDRLKFRESQPSICISAPLIGPLAYFSDHTDRINC